MDRVVRGTVEETLNALLDSEAGRLCSAGRYERADAHRDTRAGHYERGLETKAGEVTLRVPKLRRQTLPEVARWINSVGLGAPSFQYFNVAIAAADMVIAATSKHLVNATMDGEKSAVMWLTTGEIAALRLEERRHDG